MTKIFSGGSLKNNLQKETFIKVIALIYVLATINCYANEANGIEYSGSGFMTIAAGKTMGGPTGIVSGYNCPCVITDFAQAAVYTGQNSWQVRPDSKLGVQGSVSMDNKRLSLTTQVVARGASDGKGDLEWLYASYMLTDKITLQAGRQRLPMFYYSASQDIGLALPWTHLPVGPYGWEVVNYNGGSVRYKDQFGEWSSVANFFVGNEHVKDSLWWHTAFGPQSVTNVNWTNIAGTNLTLTKDWFEVRAVYIQNTIKDQQISNAWDSETMTYDYAPSPIPVAKQQIYGLALKTDYQNWLFYGEAINLHHPDLTFNEFGQNLAVGYRSGKWLPMLTWSRYQSFAMPGGESYFNNDNTTHSASLRYDLTTSSDLKLEYDSVIGHNYVYSGARLLTLAFDMVF